MVSQLITSYEIKRTVANAKITRIKLKKHTVTKPTPLVFPKQVTFPVLTFYKTSPFISNVKPFRVAQPKIPDPIPDFILRQNDLPSDYRLKSENDDSFPNHELIPLPTFLKNRIHPKTPPQPVKTHRRHPCFDLSYDRSKQRMLLMDILHYPYIMQIIHELYKRIMNPFSQLVQVITRSITSCQRLSTMTATRFLYL